MTGFARINDDAHVGQLEPSELLLFEQSPPPSRVWLHNEIELAVAGHMAAAAAMGHLLEFDVDPRIGLVKLDVPSFQQALDDRLFIALRDAERVLIEVIVHRRGNEAEIYVLGGEQNAPPMVVPCV